MKFFPEKRMDDGKKTGERKKRKYGERERAEVVLGEMALGEILVGTVVRLRDLVQNRFDGGILRSEELRVRIKKAERVRLGCSAPARALPR